MGTGKICYRCGAPEGSPNPRPEHPCDRGHAFPKDEPAVSPLARAAVGELAQKIVDLTRYGQLHVNDIKPDIEATLSRVEAEARREERERCANVAAEIEQRIFGEDNSGTISRAIVTLTSPGEAK